LDHTFSTLVFIVNNVEKGLGVGKTQKIAKEDAARQAWVAMGW
jgi:dsRNA-specific ribonuclease